MAEETDRVYLERKSDRRRRVADVACLAPVFGLGLLVLPALWGGDSRTAWAMLYVFSVWAVLIVLMAVVSRRLSVATPSQQTATADLSEQER